MGITWLPEHDKKSKKSKLDWIILGLCVVFILIAIPGLIFFINDLGTVVISLVIIMLCVIELLHRLRRFGVVVRFK